MLPFWRVLLTVGVLKPPTHRVDLPGGSAWGNTVDDVPFALHPRVPLRRPRRVPRLEIDPFLSSLPGLRWFPRDRHPPWRLLHQSPNLSSWKGRISQPVFYLFRLEGIEACYHDDFSRTGDWEWVLGVSWHGQRAVLVEGDERKVRSWAYSMIWGFFFRRNCSFSCRIRTVFRESGCNIVVAC